MQSKTRNVLLAAVTAGASFLGFSPDYSLATDRKPNIVLIVAEDAASSAPASKGGETPNINALAKSGTTFSNAYSLSSEAGPSNVGLLTGRYPQRFGFDANADGDPAASDQGKRGLDPAQVTLGGDLKTAGYATGGFGNWYLGSGDGYQPTQHGFDEFKGSAGEAATDAAAFIDHHAGEAFFAYVPLAGTDVQADEAAGKIIARLHDHALEENTLVLFVNDKHAAHWTLSDRGIHASVIASWKGKIPAAQAVDQPLSQLDIAPTVLAAAGVSPARHLDGNNLLPFLQGQAKVLPEETLYWRLGVQYAVRQGDWKLVKSSAEGHPQLFYLENGSIADLDLFNQQAERDKSLQGLWDAWNAENEQPRWVDSRWNGTSAAETADDSSGSARGSGPWKSGDSLSGKQAPSIADKALDISAEIDSNGGNGVVVTQGGAAHGYAVYLTNGKLAFAVREKGDLTTIVAKDPLGSGHFTIQAKLGQDGTLALLVNGKQVAGGKAPGPIAQQPKGGFLVGKAGAGAVGDFEAPDPFDGKIANVRVTAAAAK